MVLVTKYVQYLLLLQTIFARIFVLKIAFSNNEPPFQGHNFSLAFDINDSFIEICLIPFAPLDNFCINVLVLKIAFPNNNKIL